MGEAAAWRGEVCRDVEIEAYMIEQRGGRLYNHGVSHEKVEAA